MHGFEFADLELRLLDYPDHPSFSVKANISTLYAPGPALTEKENIEFYEKVTKEFQDLPRKEFRKITADDPYLNAIQIKFNYAITCHKSQGGEWPHVFLNLSDTLDRLDGETRLRWLYTAVTRAQQSLAHDSNQRQSRELIERGQRMMSGACTLGVNC